MPTDFRYLRVLFISDCSVEGEIDRWISALSAVISKRELNVKDKLMIYRYIFMFPPSSEAVTCVVSKRKNEIADTGSENDLLP